MALQTHNLTKIFPQEKQPLFEKLNIQFPEYGMVGIVGESGCGKTTFLHILAGIETNYQGSVCLNHRNIQSIKDYSQNYISLIYQNYCLFDFLNVYDNCVLYNKIKGIRYQNKEVLQLLKIFDLEKEKNKKARELSGGQKQRVAIIRSLLCKCPIILCDEPTGALNEEHKIKVYQLLQSYSKNHLIIIVSHDYRIKTYCDYLIDFQHLKQNYDFSKMSYQRYHFALIKKKYLFIKENLLMLFQQKHKLLMIFVSQIFIILAITFLVTGITGLNSYYTDLKKNTINNNLISIKKSNNMPFQDIEVKDLKGNYNYLLDIGKIDGVNYFQAVSWQEKLAENEVIINDAFYQQIQSRTLNYHIQNMSFQLKVKDILHDDHQEAILYYNSETLNDDMKLSTIDLSTCLVYIDNYQNVKTYISNLDYPYEGFSLVEEEFDAYYQLLNLCQIAGIIFIILSIIIAVILMFFILLSMYFEMQKYFVIFLSNGMKSMTFYLYLFEMVELICLFQAILSVLNCCFIVNIINYLDISKNIFDISKIFKYPVIFYYDYDLYFIYLFSYFIIGIVLFFIMLYQIRHINVIEMLREE